FFFEAEDGIRDWSVTGVQTCALPISPALAELSALEAAAGRAAAIGEALARAAAASGKGAGATVLWELAAEAAARAGDGEAAARWLRAAAQGEDAPRALLWALGESDAVLLHTVA